MMNWMFGSRAVEGSASPAVEVAGWMAVASDMDKLVAHIEAVDPDKPIAAPRKAQQAGRTITTLHGSPAGPTGTIAFLSTAAVGAPQTVWAEVPRD